MITWAVIGKRKSICATAIGVWKPLHNRPSHHRALLHDVRQFMSKQLLSARRGRRILPGTEHDMVPDHVGQRIHSLCGLSCLRIGMDPHPTKIVAKARLHKATSWRVKRLSGG